jgi:hypothetical protein
LKRVQTISGIDAQYNSRESGASVRSSMVYSNNGEFIVIHPNKKKSKLRMSIFSKNLFPIKNHFLLEKDLSENENKGEETKLIKLENKNETTSSQNKDNDYDRNLILRLHNKLLKFPELKHLAK